MRKFTILITLFLLLLQVSAQYPNILISNENGVNEPSIFMNPNNTQQIVAGANNDYYFYSEDGGYSWTTGNLTSTQGVCGDPSIIADSEGNFYFFHLSYPDVGNWIDRIVCQKSTDGGTTWSDGTYTGLNGTKAQDKEWSSIDRSNNYIYLTWTQFDAYGSTAEMDSSLILYSGSQDGGLTWTDPVRISQTAGDCIDDDETVEGAVPAVGTNGEVFVAWAGRKVNGELAIMFDRSYDNGETWLEEDKFVTDFPGGWTYDVPGIYRCNGLPVTVCDTSGGDYDGTIYINWTDQRNGIDDTDVWLIKSVDNGDTWSEPARVNDDEPGKQQFFTWVDIDQTTGYLYFVFYDRRNHENNATDVYMAVSKDGGATFENKKISETPFVPSSAAFFGDYTNITAHNGIIRPIWCRADGGNKSIWTAIADEDNSSIYSLSDKFFSVEEVYPNPFADEVYFSFKLREPAVVNLKVYDIYGTEIVNLIDNEFLNRGKYVEKFQANKNILSPGIYYFLFLSGDETICRKVIYPGL